MTDQQHEVVGAILRSLRRVLGVVVLVGILLLVAVAWLGYEGRKTIVEAQRAACKHTIEDRLSTIAVRREQARSAQLIADDTFQSAWTRDARRREARVLRASVRDEVTRVDPAHGGRLDCAAAFPLPSLLPRP